MKNWNKKQPKQVSISITYDENLEKHGGSIVTVYNGSALKAGDAFMKALQQAQADPDASDVRYHTWEHQRQADGSLKWTHTDQVIVPVTHTKKK